MLSFLLILTIGGLHGFLNQAAYKGLLAGCSFWFHEFKRLAGYALFFVAKELFVKEKNNKFIRVILISTFVGSIISGGYNIYCSITGNTAILELHGPHMKEGIYGGIQRSAGVTAQNYFPAMFLLAITFLIFQTSLLKRIALFALATFFLDCLILEGYRSIWIAVTLSLPFILVIHRKGKFSKKILILALLILLLYICSYSFTLITGSMPNEVIIARMRPTQIERLEDIRGVLDRLQESKALFRAFIRNPFLGQGLGYEIPFYSFYHHYYIARTNWHNDYLFFLGKLGLPGLLSFFWIIFKFFSESLYILDHSQEKKIRCLTVGFISIVLCFLTYSLVVPALTTGDSVPFIAIIFSFVAVYANKLKISREYS